jgi:hypothetical protein
MIIVDSKCNEELEVLLTRRKVGYTVIPESHGVGTTGVRMGSSAYPKTSSVFFTILTDDEVDEIKAEVQSYCEACERKMKLFVWAAEEIL